MTKEDVLEGALALNGSDKAYVVTIRDDKIIIEGKYQSISGHQATFRSIAHINDDNTYVETHENRDGRRSEFGKAVKVQRSITFPLGGDGEIKKETFHSEHLKKVLRDYLESCGYQRINKGFWRKLFGK